MGGGRIKVGAVVPLLAAEILEDSDRDATEKNLTARTATEILQEGDFCRDRDTNLLTDPALCGPRAPQPDRPLGTPRLQGGEAVSWMPDRISFSNSVLTFELQKSAKLIPTQA